MTQREKLSPNFVPTLSPNRHHIGGCMLAAKKFCGAEDAAGAGWGGGSGKELRLCCTVLFGSCSKPSINLSIVPPQQSTSRLLSCRQTAGWVHVVCYFPPSLGHGRRGRGWEMCKQNCKVLIGSMLLNLESSVPMQWHGT